MLMNNGNCWLIFAVFTLPQFNSFYKLPSLKYYLYNIIIRVASIRLRIQTFIVFVLVLTLITYLKVIIYIYKDNNPENTQQF